MHFRREAIEALCLLIDDAIARQPLSEAERQRISNQVDQIVEANGQLQASEGIERLSDDAVAALLVLLIAD